MSDTPLPEHVRENRAYWDRMADDWVAAGERAWRSPQPYWGCWGLPESQLGLLPTDMSGMEVCRSLKESETTRRIPIVMVTARGEEVDRVVGFELGADDYVVKPFSVRELLLRIQAILRRGTREAAREESVIQCGCLRIDRGARRVWVSEREIELTALEFKLLLTLFDHRNRVQTRSTLLDDVWGIQADITTRTVDTHVKRLREKLEGARDYVETVRGVGYRFVETPEEARL